MNVATGVPWMAAATALGLDLAAKATVFLVIGLILQAALTRWRPSLGAVVGHACVLGLLLLPGLVVVLPPLELQCLPALEVVPVSRIVSQTRQAAGTPEAAFPPDDSFSDRTAGDFAEVGWKPPAPDPAPIPPGPPVIEEPSSASGDAPPGPPIPWMALGLAAYALVAVMLSMRVLSSLLAVERLRRAAIPVDDPTWREALARCRRRLGIRRDVRLAWSPRVGIPIVLGWARPTIILPDRLPDEHADAILLHELSHVRRSDYPWNIALRITQALYWPHPLVWLLGRAVAEIRERVCDEFCVGELGDASSYGETLLAVAAGTSRRPAPALGLAMARSSYLARRLARIARCRGDARCLPGAPVRILVAVLAVGAAGLAGASRLTRAEPPVPVRTLDPLAEAPSPPARDGRGRVFHLQVVTADTGRPVPNADVRVWVAMRDQWRKADENGRLDLVHSTGPSDRRFAVDVWGDGRAMQRHSWGDSPSQPIPDGAVIRLQPGESLGGVVQDENGQPIRGAVFYLWSHNYQRKDPHELFFDLRAISGPDGRWRTGGAHATTGELLGFHVVHPDYLSSRDFTSKIHPIPKVADLRAGKAVTVMKKGVPIEGRVVDAVGRPVAGAVLLASDRLEDLPSEVDPFAVTTDDKGHFRTGQVQEGSWYLLARAGGHAPGVASVRITTAVPQVEIKLGRPRPLRGRVVDPSGKPVAGAFVNIDTWRGHRFLGVFLYSDADGRVRWDDAPDDDLTIDVVCQGYTRLDRQRVRPTDEDVLWTLNPSLAIHGKVRDAETEKPVEKAEVEFGAIDPGTGDVSVWSRVGASELTVDDGYLNTNFPVEAESYKIRLTADGYEPFVSRPFRRGEKVVLDYDIKLVPGRASGPLATVLRPDGKPFVGARVLSAKLDENLNVNDGVASSRGGGRELVTGPDGTFPIPRYAGPFLVLVLGDDMYAYASRTALARSPTVQARPYGRVEGRYFVGSRAVPNQPLALSGHLQDDSTMFCNLFFHRTATTDGEGRFALDKVIPLPHLRLAPRQPSEEQTRDTWSLGEAVRVASGETTRVTLGGKGRPVIGRVVPPEGWTQPVDFTDRTGAVLESNRPTTPYPPALFRGKTTLNDPSWFDWRRKWSKSPEGVAYVDSRVAVHVPLAPDGSFRFDDLPPGEYRVTVRVNEPPLSRDRGPFVRIARELTVPPIPGVRRLDPLDLGTIRLEARTVPEAGEPAPDFTVTTVDGKPLALKDFRGKFLLLDIGVLWEDQCRLQIARVNDIHQRFGKDERFAMLSLVMAADNAETRAFVADKGQPWPQAIVGPLSNPIAAAYGVEATNLLGINTMAVLIGPDGKLIARNLWYNQIGEAIGRALRPPRR